MKNKLSVIDVVTIQNLLRAVLKDESMIKNMNDEEISKLHIALVQNCEDVILKELADKYCLFPFVESDYEYVVFCLDEDLENVWEKIYG